MIPDAEALEEKYRKYAEDYGAAYVNGDHKKANRNYTKLAALLPQLRAIGKQGEEILQRLRSSQSDAVAMWASTHSLPIAEEDAVATLDSISRRGGIIGHSSKMVIREWQSGRLKFD